MADMSTIFGPSLGAIQAAQDDLELRRLTAISQNPSNFGAAQAGSMFGDAFGNAFGGQASQIDPQMQEAAITQQIQQAVIESGLEFGDPRASEFIVESYLRANMPEKAFHAKIGLQEAEAEFISRQQSKTKGELEIEHKKGSLLTQEQDLLNKRQDFTNKQLEETNKRLGVAVNQVKALQAQEDLALVQSGASMRGKQADINKKIADQAAAELKMLEAAGEMQYLNTVGVGSKTELKDFQKFNETDAAISQGITALVEVRNEVLDMVQTGTAESLNEIGPQRARITAKLALALTGVTQLLNVGTLQEGERKFFEETMVPDLTSLSETIRRGAIGEAQLAAQMAKLEVAVGALSKRRDLLEKNTRGRFSSQFKTHEPTFVGELPSGFGARPEPSSGVDASLQELKFKGALFSSEILKRLGL